MKIIPSSKEEMQYHRQEGAMKYAPGKKEVAIKKTLPAALHDQVFHSHYLGIPEQGDQVVLYATLPRGPTPPEPTSAGALMSEAYDYTQ